MTREEKLQIINNAVEYYKNSTDPNDSIKKVSKQFGIGQETLSKYLKEKGIPIKPQVHNSSKSNKLETISSELKSKQGNMSKSQFKQYLIDLAIEEYINTSIYERSIPKLADKYGVNRKTITKYLKERNIEITNTHGKVPFNEDFFDNIQYYIQDAETIGLDMWIGSVQERNHGYGSGSGKIVRCEKGVCPFSQYENRPPAGQCDSEISHDALRQPAAGLLCRFRKMAVR